MGNSDLDRVKRILVGELYDDLQRLRDEFEDDALFSEHVARVITEALQSRVLSDDTISEVLAPTIDQAISSSINQDPKKLAESLYPIMGPAIRKSISETLQQMLENFNQLLESSFSPRALRWRFDAWRTGRTYSELVMLNTLEFSIEQVFLIHRETSLLIKHHTNEFAITKDPDMVSGMFSAIQDFIEDSFATGEDDVLDTLRLGELTVLIQRGPHAVLAAVVRGRVPDHLRVDLKVTLEKLHRLKRSALTDFGGDPRVFDDIDEDVVALLQAERKTVDKERKIPWLALIVIAVAVTAAGYWEYLQVQQLAMRNGVLDQIDSEPGFVVLNHNYANGELNITLLADPDARTPEEVVPPEQTEYQVKYQRFSHVSLDKPVVLARALRLLAPTDETRLELANGELSLSGRATADWLANARNRWQAIVGIESINIDALVVYNPALDALNAIKDKVESFEFEFSKGEAELDRTSIPLQGFVAEVRDLVTDAAREGYSLSIDIVGYTDETGTDRVNRRIGLARAEAVKAVLLDAGLDAGLFRTFAGLDYGDATAEGERKVTMVVSMMESGR